MTQDVNTPALVVAWGLASLNRLPIERLMEGTLWDLSDEEAARQVSTRHAFEMWGE